VKINENKKIRIGLFSLKQDKLDIAEEFINKIDENVKLEIFKSKQVNNFNLDKRKPFEF
jgi:hypothetical protein